MFVFDALDPLRVFLLECIVGESFLKAVSLCMPLVTRHEACGVERGGLCNPGSGEQLFVSCFAVSRFYLICVPNDHSQILAFGRCFLGILDFFPYSLGVVVRFDRFFGAIANARLSKEVGRLVSREIEALDFFSLVVQQDGCKIHVVGASCIEARGKELVEG
jgi:hypothetical protein